MCNIITNFIKAELIFVLVQLLFVFKDIIWNIYEMKLEDIFHFENFFKNIKIQKIIYISHSMLYDYS